MSETQDIINSWIPLAAIVLPLLGSVPVYLFEKKLPGAGKRVALVVSLTCLVLIASLYPAIASGNIVDGGHLSLMPPLGLGFRVDALSCLYALIVTAVWPLVVWYGMTYMSHSGHHARFFTVLMLDLCGCLGLAMAGDLFTLFIFFEIMSLSAYVLIVHDENTKAMQAGFKYLIMSVTGSLSLFFGVIGTYQLAGNLSFSTSASLISTSSGLSLAVFVAFLLGFGIKAGMFPLHVWLPDAHPVAPTPASALLSGVMIKAGAFGLMRLVINVFGVGLLKGVWWPNLILWGGLISMLLGSGVAILQDDLKRRFAYSSIGQMGYILAGIAIMTRSSIAGASFHMVAHAMAKACLFLCIGAITYMTGIKTVSGLSGLGSRMPLTMAAFTAASLSMVGIPPFNGFTSKWLLSMGALSAGSPTTVLFLLISSMMACVYCFPIVISAFFSKDGTGSAERCDPPLSMLVPILTLAVGAFIFSLIPDSVPLSLSHLWSRMLP